MPAKPASRLPNGLTKRQDAFVTEFLKDFSGTAAACRAGYAAAHARTQASVLLAKPAIRAELERRNAKQVEKAELQVADVIDEIRRVAHFDITTLLDEDGAVLPKARWPEDAGKAVQSFEVVESVDGEGVVTGRKYKLKLWNKTAALDQLMRYLGLYQDTLNVKVTMEHDELASRIRAGRELVAQRRGDGSYDVQQ